jgi:hypothetical protein
LAARQRTNAPLAIRSDDGAQALTPRHDARRPAARLHWWLPSLEVAVLLAGLYRFMATMRGGEVVQTP